VTEADLRVNELAATVASLCDTMEMLLKDHPMFWDHRWSWLRSRTQSAATAARALIVDPTAKVVKPKPRKRPATPAPRGERRRGK
jgi:hypothetical protein